MGDDLMAEFGPPEETRERILEDPNLLIKATDVWVRNLGDYYGDQCLFPAPENHLGSQTTDMPQGFSQLTKLLEFWCDRSPFNINPEPLGDLDAWYQTVSLALPSHWIEPPDVGEFQELLDRARRVVDRMRNVAAALLESKQLRGPGRPKGQKSRNRKDIEQQLSKGTDPKDVRRMLRKEMTLGYILKIKREMDAEIRQKLSDGQTAADVARAEEWNPGYVQAIAAELESKTS